MKKQSPLTHLKNDVSQQPNKKHSRTNTKTLIAKAYTKSYQQHIKETSLHQSQRGQWQFNQTIAQCFNSIARREIPDYLRVIELCLRIISKSKNTQPKIIDVGSATGETLKQLYDTGYKKIYGVEASAAMLTQSFDQATLIHSEKFPEQYAPFDYVLNNWTLHFIAERTEYLAAIKRSLAPEGTLILTDKVSASPCIHDLYYDMKRRNGITEAEIEAKRQQIEGVLVTNPFTWYVETLTQLGFESIEIINANTAFVTFMAKNPA